MTSAHISPTDGDFLTPKEARDRLGVSRRTLQRYVADGVLAPAHYLPNGHARFAVATVDALRAEPDTKAGAA